jgi:type II secretory pathway component PulF
LADDAIASPLLTADGGKLIEALSGGKPLSSAGPFNVLTDSVTAAMDLACAGRDLPATMATLSQMYQQQTDVRVSMLNVLLTPILVGVMAILIGFLIVSIFMPLAALLNAISGGW